MLYSIERTYVNLIEITDEEMRDCGYEGEITEDMRKQYLEDLIEEQENSRESDLGELFDVKILKY